MADQLKKKKKKSARKKNTEGEKKRSETIKDIGKGTSDIIHKAVSILEEEVAAGIVTAKEVDRSIRENKNVQSDELNKLVARLRNDAHDIVNIVSEQFDELRSEESDDLSKKFQKDAHDAVDVMLNIVDVAPDIINLLIESKLFTKNEPKKKKKRKKKKKNQSRKSEKVRK